MDKRHNGGMNTRRAGCGGSRTSGSEGGPEKPTRRKTGQALRPDPYTEFPTGEGKLYVAGIRDLCHQGLVGWSMGEHQDAVVAGQALAEFLARHFDGHCFQEAAHRLLEGQTDAARDAREGFFGVWDKLDRKKARRWLKAGR